MLMDDDEAPPLAVARLDRTAAQRLSARRRL
jgi:hypothetical protein